MEAKGVYLHKGKSRPRFQSDVLVGLLIFHILFQTLLFINFPLLHHIEESSGRHGNGDGILRPGLKERGKKKTRVSQKTQRETGKSWEKPIPVGGGKPRAEGKSHARVRSTELFPLRPPGQE